MPGAADTSQERLDALYGLPRDEFIPARDALARELRADGDREAAARAKALRKPSVAAWALNQVSRSEPKRVQALLSAAADLRTAQEALLSGGGHEPLRSASAAQRSALESVAERAQRLLEDAGHGSGATIQNKLFETLQAASRDPELAEQLRAGRLLREAEIGDLGLGGLDLGEALAASTAARRAAPAPAKKAPAPKKPDPAVARRRRTLTGRLERARAIRAEREQEHRELARAAREAEREAVRAAAAATRAAERVQRGRAQLDEAGERVADLERELADLDV